MVEQRGIDVIIQVSSETGKSLGEFDSPNGTQGPENVSFVAVTAGTYRLTVGPLDPKDKTRGSYEIKILELRPATEQELKASKNVEITWAKGLALFNDVDAMIAEIRSPQTRIRAEWQAAQLLSQTDEKRSSRYLTDAAGLVREFVTNIEPGGNDYIRNFSVMTQLRAEIATVLTARDPEAALEFLRSTRMPFDPYGNERERTSQEIALCLRVASEVVMKDPKPAIQMARQSLKKGYSPDIINTLSMLRQKNPQLATEFANEVAAKLIGDKLLTAGYGAHVTAGNLMRGCRTVPRDLQAGINEPSGEPFLSLDVCRDLVQKTYREAIAFKLPPETCTRSSEMQRGTFCRD